MQSHPKNVLTEVEDKHCESPQNVISTPEKSSDIASTILEDATYQSFESIPNQLVLYDHSGSNTSLDALVALEPTEDFSLTSESSCVPNPSSRVLPSVGAFTVQCAACFKWRLIPTKEKYEEIRETILQEPFLCDRAREWRPDITCDDPEDISQDGSRLWAIDKPNIAQPPPGWERLLRIRGEGSTRFADIYYVAPSGKRLRSMVEIERYLLEHPEYVINGVNMSQFSFQIPRPLQENYVRKRPRFANPHNGGLGLPKPLELNEVNPLSWESPFTCTDLQTGRSGSSTINNEHPGHPPTMEPATPKRKKKAVAKPSRKRAFASPPSTSDMQIDGKEHPDSPPLVEPSPSKKKKKATSKKPSKQALGSPPASKNLQSGGAGLLASSTDLHIDSPGQDEHTGFPPPAEPSPSKKKKISEQPSAQASSSPPAHKHLHSSGAGLSAPDNEQQAGYITLTKSSSPMKKNKEVAKSSTEQACSSSSECNRLRIKIKGPKQPESPTEPKVVYFQGLVPL